VNAQAYELPALDERTVEHLDLIATRLRSGEFSLGGGAWRFSLAPLSGAVPRPADPFHVAMEWGGGQLHLLAGRATLALLYAHQFPQAPLDVFPEHLALAGLQLAWRESMERLEQLSGRRVRLLRAARALPDALDAAPFRFRLALDSAPARDGVDGVIAADAPGLGLLGLLARRLPPATRRVDPDTPVPVRLELGEMRLTLSTLRALALNDVLLPDTVIEAEPLLWLRSDPRHAARARLEERSLIIESVFQEDSFMPTSVSTSKHDAQDPVGLEDIEFRVAFDLGEKTLKLGELAALQPGQVLALEAPAPRLVAIRANGRLIGRGELVRLADTVGVRVMELADAEASKPQPQGIPS
jgi:type III secretion protein Q